MRAREYKGMQARAAILVAIAISISIGVVGLSQAQMRPVTHIDDSVFHSRLSQISKAGIARLPIGERIVAIGKLFLGTPYVGGTLDVDSAKEELVVNLHGLDCVTFYENALALSRVIAKFAKPTLYAFQRELMLLRYRRGKIDGFHSRLHYSTDYFRDGESKHVFHNITSEIGGRFVLRDTSKIEFMTHHRSLYRQIAKDDEEYREIGAMEAELNEHGRLSYIPKGHISEIESQIESGDILGIATDIPGLDFSHTGIAVRMKDGRIHFMHASSLMHKVIVSEEPLAEYLTHSARQIGIVVNRPLEALGVSQSHRQNNSE